MRKAEFETWLKHHYLTANGTLMDSKVRGSRISNCVRVEKFEGDLNEHYRKDEITSLLRRLEYSQQDHVQNRPVLHNILIDGNKITGTATLRSAVNLYAKFCEDWPEGSHNPKSPLIQELSGVEKTRKQRVHISPWPKWTTPNDSEVLQFAHLTVPFLRFLHPDLVGALVDDNKRHFSDWSVALEAKGFNANIYLWSKSSCAFPGIRRYAGSKEIAAFRGHGTNDGSILDAVELDDNSYPKHIWAFSFTGKEFRKHGPSGYALAHLADHKKYKNRYAEEFDILDEKSRDIPLHGLYTSCANTIYIPNTLIKPTDFSGPLRNLLMRRAHFLYGQDCNLLPPWLRIQENHSSEWDLDEFDWAAPVGTVKNLKMFLDFRRKKMDGLLRP